MEICTGSSEAVLVEQASILAPGKCKHGNQNPESLWTTWREIWPKPTCQYLSLAMDAALSRRCHVDEMQRKSHQKMMEPDRAQQRR